MSTTLTRRTIRVEHLARVEGHGGISVELDGDRIEAVRFDVFEGIRLIEGLIGGRSWEDVSQIVSRICAICSVAHSMTSIRVTERVFGVRPSAQTERLRDLLWRGESIESHALHLFLLAAPDYLGYPSGVAMAADHPQAVALALRLKRLGNLLQGGVGGREIHPVNAVPGGFGQVPDEARLMAMRNALLAARPDIEAALELVRSLPPTRPMSADTVFVALLQDEDYRYDVGDEVGILDGDHRRVIAAETLPKVAPERTMAHSHAKHSHIDGRPFMVGALARLTINRNRLGPEGESLINALGLTLPSRDPMDNNRAQAVELAMDVGRALRQVESLLEMGPVAEAPVAVTPRAGAATVVTEAPRGMLLHSYTYGPDGHITRANVITPTAFNAASLEAHFRAAVERDGTADEPALRRTLEMIARAYDPCISCSVHLSRRA
ncbi:MAG: Ni/Fe hydrogenase subunit alpha [Gemmatimonadaceae bacterium]|nr:Ni/Fe hydrogenase subunit alpha [Gemmatimonadaceae bacterium]